MTTWNFSEYPPVPYVEVLLRTGTGRMLVGYIDEINRYTVDGFYKGSRANYPNNIVSWTPIPPI